MMVSWIAEDDRTSARNPRTCWSHANSRLLGCNGVYHTHTSRARTLRFSSRANRNATATDPRGCKLLAARRPEGTTQRNQRDTENWEKNAAAMLSSRHNEAENCVNREGIWLSARLERRVGWYVLGCCPLFALGIVGNDT